MQDLMAGWNRGFMLLFVGLLLLLYFLPAIVAFWGARKRFYPLLVLNLMVGPVQAWLLQHVAPDLAVIYSNQPLRAWSVLALINLGPGWLVLLAWALMPGATDPKLAAARETKTFDFIAALPLVIWFGSGALNLRPYLVNDLSLILDGRAAAIVYVQFFSLIMSAAFNLLLVWMLLVRDKPRARGKGICGRVFAIVGTFLGVGVLQLPPAQLGFGMQLLAALLTGFGSLGSLLVLWRLGVAFSIMPEARRLVTGGPYAFARHPLYVVEFVTLVGTAIQFRQPWSTVILLGVGVLLIVRSVFEERVLSESFPDYAAYRAKTARFIPGVI